MRTGANGADREYFAGQLNALMRAHGTTAESLGESIGRSVFAVRSYVSGRSVPAEKIIQKIADEFGVPLTELKPSPKGEPAAVPERRKRRRKGRASAADLGITIRLRADGNATLAVDGAIVFDAARTPELLDILQAPKR